ncbi:hypothetical protein [Cellulomonas xylanilytica]|uniref:DUF11 domain-containing protein n=1 Tax=Cellulomonas xylanilytica TaxID=233583 RepID=A0A510V4E2_9CELL|nr:hypothetical protein [Cellulomonas xylanilytica]GEK21749.1 hypothetical protein CXY01_22690 [Cellulomonas xylanilytica]
MTILTDLAEAFETYPRDFLDVQIVQVDPPGAVINAGEEVLFRIQVANSGPLDANQLSLLVEGLNGTLVRSNGVNPQFQSSFTISGAFFGDVPAHSATTPRVSAGDKFAFRPSTSSTSPRDLVRVSVAGYDSNLDHMTIGHSRADAEANDVYTSTVSPA